MERRGQIRSRQMTQMKRPVCVRQRRSNKNAVVITRGHDLDTETPLGKVAVPDRVVQILLGRLARAADDLGGLGVRPVPVALQRLEVELDLETLALVVDQGEGVGAVAVDVADAHRQAAVGHQDRHLVQTLRRQRPEVPHRGGRTQVGPGVALLRVDEVRKLVGVAHEEDRRVVADHVPVALLGVELEREATHIAFGVGGPQLAGHGREPRDHRRLLADLGEEPGLRIAGDVVRDRQGAVGAPTLRMDGPLRNALTVLVRQLLDQLVVLQQDRAARPGGHRVLVVGHRCAGAGGQLLLLGHGAEFSSLCGD